MPEKGSFESAKLGVSLAAKLAFFEWHAWRRWETEEDSDNARSPSPATF